MNLQKAGIVILEYLALKDAVQKADVIFVFGELNLSSINKAANLYLQGLSKYITFVCNKGPYTPAEWVSEADKYIEVLLEKGVPREDIIGEALSTNTLEEAQLSMKLLKKHNLYPASMILIARPFHQRRSYATFKKQHPNIKYINLPSDDKFLLTPERLPRLVAELERILIYAKLGDIEPQEFPREVLESWRYIKKELKC